MIVPTFSISPKLGASLGALGAYLHYFDEKSQVSMFGVSAQYTSTGSIVAGAFGKTSFDEDRQRLILAVFAATSRTTTTISWAPGSRCIPRTSCGRSRRVTSTGSTTTGSSAAGHLHQLHTFGQSR